MTIWGQFYFNIYNDLSTDFHELRPEYIKKLKKIGKEKGKVFENKESFLDFLKNEI